MGNGYMDPATMDSFDNKILRRLLQDTAREVEVRYVYFVSFCIGITKKIAKGAMGNTDTLAETSLLPTPISGMTYTKL
jgi:hypothetical protein